MERERGRVKEGELESGGVKEWFGELEREEKVSERKECFGTSD